jgi:hypothetical protein
MTPFFGVVTQPLKLRNEGFCEIRPAATMISAGLADSRMKIEIQVTAKLSIVS